ncbi:MAG: sulfate ABC transporter permease subunit CysT [Thermostichales cyanobacterium SZTDM-1c_bins_54]
MTAPRGIPWRVTWGYLLVLLVLPIVALLSRASTVGWGDFGRIATQPVALSAYEVTFVTALGTALVNGVMGTLTAWVLVRYEFAYKKILESLIDLPFALPTAVAGLSLATVYSSNGWLGSLVAPWGVRISFTRLGVAVAMLFISFPFVVRTVQPVLQELDREVEEAAWSLGAGQGQTFRRVLLPPLLPAILTGVALGFSRAVGEFGSIVIIASSIPFRDLIAAVLVIQRLEQYDYAGATVIGTVMLAISLVSLLVINLLQSWGRGDEI